MKSIVTSIALMSVFAVSNAQTNATNFTATDCSSTSHALFTELNSGKVIVLTWIMPCASCVNGAKAASTAVQSFATSNPGKVMAYLSDDMGDQTCSDLSTWMTSNSVGTNFTVFGNAGNTINEANYGGSGMPHVVVMGGTDHKIYYNQKGSAVTASGITTAVNSALASTGVSTITNQIHFSISPNPVTDKLSLNYAKAIEKVSISSLTGQIVKEEVYTNGKVNPIINVSGMANGVYTIKITDVEGKSGINKLIKE
jgi:hypothetical protein